MTTTPPDAAQPTPHDEAVRLAIKIADYEDNPKFSGYAAMYSSDEEKLSRALLAMRDENAVLRAQVGDEKEYTLDELIGFVKLVRLENTCRYEAEIRRRFARLTAERDAHKALAEALARGIRDLKAELDDRPQITRGAAEAPLSPEQQIARWDGVK